MWFLPGQIPWPQVHSIVQSGMPSAQTANTGLIFQIQRFSLDDGPGIRTTIFLKGCNLRCAWCHNPESIQPRVELAFQTSLCTRCGACAATCTHGAQVCGEEGRTLDRSACSACLSCAAVCPSGALSVYGQEMTSAQVMETILRDRPFYAKSGGGVTFSGGEPLLQPAFLLEMLQLCRANGLHTAVDTAGNVPVESLLSMLPYTGLFLYDIKAYHPDLHRRLTGVDNTRILANLQRLCAAGARVWVRLPYISGVNHGQAEISAIAGLLKELSAVEKVELLPYHSYGEAKYEHLDAVRSPLELRAPPHSELLAVIDTYQARGLRVECPVF